LHDDLKGASLYGEYALELLKNYPSPVATARTTFLVHSFIYSWTRPLRSSLAPLIQAYNMGLEHGHTGSAEFAIVMWLSMRFILGTPLESMTEDALQYLEQMKELNRYQTCKLAKALGQALLNLMGTDNADDPTSVTGRCLSEEDIEDAQNEPFWWSAVCAYNGALLTYFSDHVRHAKLIAKRGHDRLANVHGVSRLLIALVGKMQNGCYLFPHIPMHSHRPVRWLP